MVFICTVFTVINVCGFAHFMGLTIELVTSICLILSPGLALDYAAHVGVVFVSLQSGSRHERMQQTLEYDKGFLNSHISGTETDFFFLPEKLALLYSMEVLVPS